MDTEVSMELPFGRKRHARTDLVCKPIPALIRLARAGKENLNSLNSSVAQNVYVMFSRKLSNWADGLENTEVCVAGAVYTAMIRLPFPQPQSTDKGCNRYITCELIIKLDDYS